MKTSVKTGIYLTMLGLAACQNDLESEELLETDEIVNPSGEEQALTMPACGTALASFDGTDARSNAGNTGTGNSCAGVGGIAGGLQYQCVELVMRHFKRKWDVPALVRQRQGHPAKRAPHHRRRLEQSSRHQIRGGGDPPTHER